MSKARYNNANPTMNRAIRAADVPGAADRMQARERIRQEADAARNERIRRARELAQGGPTDGAA